MRTFAVLALEEGLIGRPDWSVLGLISAIIGAFLIANAILFEHPRRLVARYFGRNTGRLQSVREYVYNRVQTTLGFTFLLGGFALQLVGQYQLRADLLRGDPVPEPLGMFWVGLLVVVAVGLLFSGWWWSLWAFRRYVREYFTQNPRDLEGEPTTARELGELFGIEPEEDDTVADYVARLRRETGLPRPGELPLSAFAARRGSDVFRASDLGYGNPGGQSYKSAPYPSYGSFSDAGFDEDVV